MEETRAWTPESTESFRDLDFQGRVEALTSGANNYFGKVLALAAMKSELPYAPKELYDQMKKTLGRDSLPFYRTTPFHYCESSLAPIGMAVKGMLRKGRRTVSAFAKTSDADEFALPMAARFLMLGEKLDVSLTVLNGETHSGKGTVRRGYVTAMILQMLTEEVESTAQRMEDKIGLTNAANALNALQAIGLVEYDHVASDTYGTSELGYSTIRLSSIATLEKLLADPALRTILMKTRLFNKSTNTLLVGTDKIKILLERRLEKLDNCAIADILGISKNNASSILTALCQLGAYEHERFVVSDAQSSASITEVGKRAYEFAFKHVLLVAKDPSYAATPEYREVFEHIGVDGILKLLAREERRYLEGKHLHVSGLSGQNAARVYNVLESHFGNGSPFRQADVKSFLRTESRGKLAHALHDLKLQELIRPTIVSVTDAEGNVRTVSRGYYTLNKTRT